MVERKWRDKYFLDRTDVVSLVRIAFLSNELIEEYKNDGYYNNYEAFYEITKGGTSTSGFTTNPKSIIDQYSKDEKFIKFFVIWHENKRFLTESQSNTILFINPEMIVKLDEKKLWAQIKTVFASESKIYFKTNAEFEKFKSLIERNNA